jgi:hypothetical protein
LKGSGAAGKNKNEAHRGLILRALEYFDSRGPQQRSARTGGSSSTRGGGGGAVATGLERRGRSREDREPDWDWLSRGSRGWDGGEEDRAPVRKRARHGVEESAPAGYVADLAADPSTLAEVMAQMAAYGNTGGYGTLAVGSAGALASTAKGVASTGGYGSGSAPGASTRGYGGSGGVERSQKISTALNAGVGGQAKGKGGEGGVGTAKATEAPTAVVKGAEGSEMRMRGDREEGSEDGEVMSEDE